MAKRKYEIDEKKIERFSKEGRGTGHGGEYKPWLTIHDVPSLGRVSRIHSFKTGREHHCLSDLEAGLFRILDWSDRVVDVREQYPLDRDVTRMLAQQMGAVHPRDPKSRVDIVMTVDMLVDVRLGGRVQSIAYSVKPASELMNRRTLEKLEMERRWCAREKIRWHLVTDRDLPERRIMNLEWLHEMRSLAHEDMPHADYWHDRCDRFVLEFQRVRAGSIHDFFMHLERRCGFAVGEPLKALRHLAANKRVLIDLDKEFSVRDRFDVLGLPASEQTRLQVVGA
ncbi:TnsA endonuclease N-terminal domain-containing protein [Stenotrophomonas maltophilia]|uniref:TnsA endonuclease N-terminal domain-containing protein n=1 Tax=Stenotrophomonas maltophilia TaxID=40324 RepID=UPI0021BF1474|nr:TnsA endonuclease N-terminal domain-containing protein [Stenotrophomonas maltophilia]UXL29805.1 TnsA endonuclease N-terminal domain-containing protein [Stenotrophomonas maltophilia]